MPVFSAASLEEETWAQIVASAAKVGVEVSPPA